MWPNSIAIVREYGAVYLRLALTSGPMRPSRRGARPYLC
jgi:hypothetical protein